MRIINLVENEIGESGLEAAHGLSFYIETENHKILFDTSPNNLVITNAQKLGVDLSSIDTVILSHGHYDHCGGVLAFTEINSHARIYIQKSAGDDYYAFDGQDAGYRYIGIDKKILSLPQVVLLDGDEKIDEELRLFTVDFRDYPFPSTNSRLKMYCGGKYIQDDFLHEQNLLLMSEGKKILFCGCAHNGILNILEALERKLGPTFLPDMVIGGFHLMKLTDFSKVDNEEIVTIANKLKKYKAHFATCHCTGLVVYNQMKEIMGDQLSYIHCGDRVNLTGF